jgi:pimeloyl-ACP methyl ester carboxylesterase
MNSLRLRTRRGLEIHVREAGSNTAPPVVFLHGVLGLLEDDRLLDALARHFHVLAPELPGYGLSSGEERLEDMLDFTLHGLDVLEELDLHAPVLVGHSLGGMLAAEMACLAPAALNRLVLIDPFGLWLDECPIPDLFSLLPYEFGELLFHEAQTARKLLPGATDFADPEALRQFVIDTTRQLGTAGKLLFPIPNRRLSKRLYRLRTPTLLVWGQSDQVVPANAYAARWQALLPDAQTVTIPNAGHMLPYEQPGALASEIIRFAATPVTVDFTHDAAR